MEKVNMSDLEVQDVIGFAHALTEEQKKLAIKEFPDEMLWEELKRRYDISIKLKDSMKALVSDNK